MSNPVTISPAPPAEQSMNFDMLRTEGLRYIEQVASRLWTDYNVHDPGITLLELLCYAITDLGYRTAIPINDLLATQTDNKQTFQQQFFSAAQILPSHPVTVNDYRKLFIDLPGVKNAWLRKAVSTVYLDDRTNTLVAVPPLNNTYRTVTLNGIYDVLLELDAFPPDITPEERTAQQNALIQLATETFHRNRNLCEDLGTISLVPEQRIQVCADIEIKADADPDKVMAEVLFGIQQYMSPIIPQYPLAEMLKRGYPMDEIFEGPYLQNGFIPDDALQGSTLRQTIYSSDIIGIVMDIPGVVSVKKILLNYCDMPVGRHEWCLPVKPWTKPTLCLDKAAIHLFKDVIPVTVKRATALQLLNEKINIANVTVKSTDYDYGLGRYVDAESYTPLLHHLPLTYGVGPHGLPATATDERRGVAKQLKGYLLFFDQLLANYLSQLRNMRKLFRLQFSDAEMVEKPQTYFFQKLGTAGFPGIENLLKEYATFENPSADPGTPHLPEMAAGYDDPVERSNRFLDHLLSRFAERFSDYVMQLYSLYGQKAGTEVLVDKRIFLQEYPVISRDRSSAFDYFNEDVTVWDTDNVTGMEHRIARLIGIPNYHRRNISNIKYEIYQEKDTDGIDEFRFRLMDPDTNKILLSSSQKYYIREQCEADFKRTMRIAADRNNYILKVTRDGKPYFNVADEGDVIARRIEYFDTEDERESAISFLLQFIKQHYSDEGLFVVEHILLRPDILLLDSEEEEATNPANFLPVCADKDCEDGCANDPYSFRVTVILPANTARFRETGFREYIDKLIRMETPAHIQPKICWLNDTEMEQFEESFRTWLELKQRKELNTPEGLIAQQALIHILYNVKSIYPTGELSDCASPSQTPVILGRTNIGNQNA